MGLEITEPNTCIRGCCHSQTIPLHLRPSSYSLSSPIARGAESVVYEGILDGKKVAVKKPVLSTSDDLDKFHKELQLLSKLNHPGILKLVAAHARPPNYMFFFEFYEVGNLAQKLHMEEWSPSIGQAIEIAAQLAQALLYLHSLGIVHRDVKPANILVMSDSLLIDVWQLNEKLHPHLADFVLRKEIQTEKSDVYSFGVTVNELLTGVVPYTDLRAEAQDKMKRLWGFCYIVAKVKRNCQNMANVGGIVILDSELHGASEAHTVLEMNYTEQQLTAAVVSEGLRPALAGPELGASTSLLSLIQRCWDGDPRKRPSFNDIVLELDLMLECGERPDDNSVISCGHVDSINSQSYQLPLNWFTHGQDFPESSYASSDNVASTWLSSNGNMVYHPVLSWGSFSTCGRRETMEDTHFMIPHFCNQKDIHFFGILDGHRGAEAAEFSAGALPGFLRNLVSVSSPSQALLEAFIKTDVAFRNELNSRRKFKSVIQKDSHPGCTAITTLVVKNKLFVANAGDCRTIICRSGKPYALSRDHVASCLEERERVIGAGGQVKWQVDTWRIGPAALQVMASDGLWDVMSNIDVVNIIRDTVKESGMCSKRLAIKARWTWRKIILQLLSSFCVLFL
ncbi:hypothetical protein DH2020_041585 [Rehmannia glutinosa]|uniref:Protein-serine/threonine phosphatase n=1 Tax=Rehmannia glutinosa TaxID=99300 RepID=A0ABR0UQS9_REHGL